MVQAAAPIDPNDLIDPSEVGWEEVVLAIGILIVSVILAAVVRRVVRSATMRWAGDKPDVAVFAGRVSGWFIILLGVVAALMILGFQLGPMFLIILVIGLVLFLSARTLFENLGAGIVLQTENSFSIGDLVELGGWTGTVHDITARTTVLDAYDGRRVKIPNSAVLGAAIVNYTERGRLGSEIVVGVEYGTDLDRAQRVILETVGSVAGVLTDPAPEAFALEFGESSINFTVRFWHDPTLHSRYRMVDEASRAIDRSFRVEGLVIAFPQVVVWPGDTDKTS